MNWFQPTQGYSAPNTNQVTFGTPSIYPSANDLAGLSWSGFNVDNSMEIDPSKVTFNEGLDVQTPDGLTAGQIAGLGLKGLQTLGNLYMGNQQLKLGRQQLAQGIRAFNANYNAQRDLSNAAMYDRNYRRNLELGKSRAEAEQAATDYVSARGIKALSK